VLLLVVSGDVVFNLHYQWSSTTCWHVLLDNTSLLNFIWMILKCGLWTRR